MVGILTCAAAIGVALLLWVHVSRLARPVLLPPRGLVWATTGMLLVASLVWPAPLGPRAAIKALHAFLCEQHQVGLFATLERFECRRHFQIK